MISIDETNVYISLGGDNTDLTFVKDSYGQIKFCYEKKQTDYEVLLYLTQDAMICLGVHLIRLASSDLYGYDMRNDPIGDMETVTMGIRIAPGCGSIFFYQNKSEKELEDIIEVNTKPVAWNTDFFTVDIENETEQKYEENFKSTVVIEIHEKKTGNRVYDDTIFYFNKEGLLGLGVVLIRIAYHFQTGKTFTVYHSVEEITKKEDSFPGVIMAEDSADLKICCAELPDRGTYIKQLNEMREQVLDKESLIRKLQAVLDGNLTREELAKWATIYRYADSKERCKEIRMEIQQISVLDQKSETGEYIYDDQTILDFIEIIEA